MNSKEAPFGDWVLDNLGATYYIEREGWAPERARRVLHRLQKGRSSDRHLTPVVFFGRKETAFTVEGRYVFISRRVMERCHTDAACAWILAHEIAHHDLGHVARLPEWMVRYSKSRGAWVVAALAERVVHRVLGPEREADADRHATDLCLAAGYSPDAFLGAFDAIEALVADVGSYEVVYGPEFAMRDEVDGGSPLLRRFRVWQWERATGYFPFKRRRELVEAYLASMTPSAVPLRTVPDVEIDPPPPEDPWRLSPERRGLFTSPALPPTPELQPTIVVGARRWMACLAPDSQVLFLDTEDDAQRMLARVKLERGTQVATLAQDAISRVHRRWWRGRDGSHFVVETNGTDVAVIAKQPFGPWKPDVIGLTCLRAPDRNARIMPWHSLGHASEDELEAMREGHTVVVFETPVEVAEDWPAQ